MSDIVCVRGGGDLSTGTIQKLHRAGFKVVVHEMERPLCVRRTVSVSEAVYERRVEVEGMTAVLVQDVRAAISEIACGVIPVIVDPHAGLMERFKPIAVIDATISKRNIGTNKSMAPITIALGPGYEAGVDVDYVIETERGHDLGRIIFEGYAAPDTGKPGNVGGYSLERVYYSPISGRIKVIRDISSVVECGEIIAYIEDIPVEAKLKGIVRGMLRDGIKVPAHVKIADIDPRYEDRENCFTISDKARSIGGGVLEALLMGINRLKSNYHNDNRVY